MSKDNQHGIDPVANNPFLLRLCYANIVVILYRLLKKFPSEPSEFECVCVCDGMESRKCFPERLDKKRKFSPKWVMNSA